MHSFSRALSLPMRTRNITVHSDGTLDMTLVVELFTPLFLKIHERNQSEFPALRPVPEKQQRQDRRVHRRSAP